jgi:transcriptional regulator with XRE-family HTH domain
MMVGTMIRCWRRIEDVGLRDAAKQIGVSHGTLSRIERGDQMDAYTMMKLLRWLFETTRTNHYSRAGGKGASR